MTRSIEEPQVKEGKGPAGDETVMTHPAFGQVTVSRVQGRRALYGSDFEHQSFVRVTVHRSELHRSLSYDRPYPTQKIVSFDMSEAQWANHVSSFGSGTGVQCTLALVVGEGSIPEFPLRDEGQEYKVEQDKALAEALENLRELRATIQENVQGLSKAKQESLLRNVDQSIRKLSDSMPFIAGSFAEHMEKRVEKAKVEIHAYLGDTVRRAGLDALQGGASGPFTLEGRSE